MLYQWSSESYPEGISGPERGLGVSTPGAAFYQHRVGGNLCLVLQFPFLSEEVSDICSAQSFRGSPAELAPGT